MLRSVSPLLSLALMASCIPKASPLPPPLERGKCLAAHYVGPLATDQTCNMDGYSWHCLADPAKGLTDVTCDRGPEVAESPVHVPSGPAAR